MEWIGDRKKHDARRRGWDIVRSSARMVKITVKRVDWGTGFKGGSAGATDGAENVALVQGIQKIPGSLFPQMQA